MAKHIRFAGIGAIVLAIGFNVPYAILASTFDYPAILRQPAGEVLKAFAAGGPALVLTWYAFFISAVLMIPLAIAIAFYGNDWQKHPALSIGGAIIGTLAGLSQAVGLSRWVFAVPSLAGLYMDPVASMSQKAAAEVVFDMLNHWGGVAIGEHIGQVLTLLWVGCIVLTQSNSDRRMVQITAAIGSIAVLSMGFGLGDGLMIALGDADAIFALGTIIGYVALSAWLLLTGILLIRLAPNQTA